MGDVVALEPLDGLVEESSLEPGLDQGEECSHVRGAPFVTREARILG